MRFSEVFFPFCEYVIQGKQFEAEEVLSRAPQLMREKMLVYPTHFYDHLGGVFTCSAVQYACWALDNHMLDMFSRYVNIKYEPFLSDVAHVFNYGVEYIKNGIKKRVFPCFWVPVLERLEFFENNFDRWVRDENWEAMRKAWQKIGEAQRHLPVNAINEYCRPDLSFCKRLSANQWLGDEPELPRTTNFVWCINGNGRREGNLKFFPLDEPGCRLGSDFTLARFHHPVASAFPAITGRDFRNLFERTLLSKELIFLKKLTEFKYRKIEQFFMIRSRLSFGNTISKSVKCIYNNNEGKEDRQLKEVRNYRIYARILFQGFCNSANIFNLLPAELVTYILSFMLKEAHGRKNINLYNSFFFSRPTNLNMTDLSSINELTHSFN